MRLSTGFVRASGYDRKVRRVLFAMLGDKLSDDAILKAAAELNKKVFEELQKKGIEKRDVIRIMCEFDIENGEVVWDWNSLRIEAYEEAAEVGAKMSALLAQMEEQDKLLEEALDKLMSTARKLREVADEIEKIISDLKKARELVPSRGS
ncbi:MAG: single- stranded DNA-binding family protein [Candidatus Njordarchaeales archaeon]